MKYSLSIVMLLLPICVLAQNIEVDVNLNIKHSVGNVSEFDREKFITVHAGIRENDFNLGLNDPADIKDDLMNGYDVYFGRNTGHITYLLNAQVREDANRPGYADLDHLKELSVPYKEQYNTTPDYYNYGSRNNSTILAAQLHPFWPDGQKTNTGWAFSETDTENEPLGTATGEYIAHYIKEFHDNETSEVMPKYFEVINEPVWHLVDYGATDIKKIFEFHNTVATEIRKENPDLLIGGYTTAFPDFELNNFERWEERWDTFMDMCGDKMDFWSVHLYDFPTFQNKEQYRKGSNIEATLDMMEHASFNKFNVVKPFVISEYGAQAHAHFQEPWSPERDWLMIKSLNSMLLSFMDRPDLIAKVIPFIVLKAEWGKENGVPYNWRLMRQKKEAEGETGNEWVYTEFIKFYDLWKNVKGTRVDILSQNIDIQTDAFVEDKKVHIILSNLNPTSSTIALNTFGVENDNIASVEVKHLYANNNVPILAVNQFTTMPEELTLGAEATIIVEVELVTPLEIGETSTESKYYATEYYQEITAGTPLVFSIDNVLKEKQGEVVLRLGLGRDHGVSLQPKVLINGQEVAIPENIKGDNQTDKDRFFGVVEIPIDYDLLDINNTISVTFPDNGGHVSSVALRVFNFSIPVERSFNTTVPPTAIIPIAKANNKLVLHPNPTMQEQVSVVVKGNKIPEYIEFVDLSGKVVLTQNMGLNTMKIDVRNLKNGIYIVRVHLDKQVLSQKLIIK
ncbi:T9SS type A sorting domain-containing protein [Flammeovirga kamogawensis]|uniref:T9SS type A sorting domain-containing protein n=1 Tax=Flammeovirga kamogawensis TaxID=373891 RepID=A0ABX8H3H0_9BACT|nr:T9SS type A sorting domain-containing protein [Flammeovirga kamogawensis]MBB6460360.1 agarase [Flammeovirga kamogawensis]QWG10169.1 T9SS type A sorting domain-containing protein [Flammeovirga kamogawensis]TRX64621.1 T9SS type A sorting domain-containing protein [Flammeovirga kamogawensis]